MNFLLVVKHRFKVYERRDWRKMKKKKKLNVLHPIGIQRSRYEYIWLLIWSKERWVVWGKGGGGWGGSSLRLSQGGLLSVNLWTDAVLKHAELILYICFFHFISRRKKRTKDSKALKRPYKSRVYIFLLSTHVSRAWRENQEGCISDDTCRYLFFY